MIRNIVFDLGNVLVSVDFDRFRNGLLLKGISEKEFDSLYPVRKAFEKGSYSSKEFLDIIVKKLKNKMAKKEFVKHYNGMFGEVGKMKKFLKSLANEKRYRFLLLSNTNPLHFNYIRKKFDYINFIAKFVLSYKLKSIKPELKIYRAMMKRYKLIPEETIFIDDLIENCVTAEKLRLNVIHYTDYNSFETKFKKLISNS